MDSGVWDQVGLELSDIDVKGTIESEGGGKGGDNLSDKSVKVGVGWSLNIEGSSTDIIDSLVIEHDGDCLLYTSPSPRDYAASRMPSSA